MQRSPENKFSNLCRQDAEPRRRLLRRDKVVIDDRGPLLLATLSDRQCSDE
jgi:hypothetical protein